MHQLLVRETGQGTIETAVAAPILVLLVAGCVQLAQIGLGHVVVMDAVYEAGRQAVIDQQDLSRAQKIAAEICRTVSPGTTRIRVSGNDFLVTHQLEPLFSVLPKITISHRCPQRVFFTEPEDQP